MSEKPPPMDDATMTDLELTKRCAEAMGLNYNISGEYISIAPSGEGAKFWRYDPLHDDAQAMALVKKFRLESSFGIEWTVIGGDPVARAQNQDLNRAIVLCVSSLTAHTSQGGK